MTKIGNLYSLRGYWREVEIILNNIQSLPYTEIHIEFNNYYPEPFSVFEGYQNMYLCNNDVKYIINKILQELNYMSREIQDWILKI